jgi:hypothetical protein
MKGGGREWYQSIGLAFLHNRICFLDTLKGLLSCCELQKTSYSVKVQKKVESLLMWIAIPKISRA